MKRFLQTNITQGTTRILTSDDMLNGRWSLTPMEVEALADGEALQGAYLSDKLELTQLPDMKLFYVRADYGTLDSNRSFSVMAETAGQALWLHMLYDGEIEHEDILGEIALGNLTNEDIADALEIAEERIDWGDVIVWEQPLSPIPGVRAYTDDVTAEAKAGYEALKAEVQAAVNAPGA